MKRRVYDDAIREMFERYGRDWVRKEIEVVWKRAQHLDADEFDRVLEHVWSGTGDFLPSAKQWLEAIDRATGGHTISPAGPSHPGPFVPIGGVRELRALMARRARGEEVPSEAFRELGRRRLLREPAGAQISDPGDRDDAREGDLPADGASDGLPF